MVNVGIVGATGYTGMELMRILIAHPGVELVLATSRKRAGEAVGEAIPRLRGATDLRFTEFDPDEVAVSAELVFLCLPHGGSMEAAAALHERGVKVVDLSADFRLNDSEAYKKWYGDHTRPDLLKEAVYGLPELHRESISEASLVANPGCYPTSVILGLIPLLENGLVDPGTIIADSKSGTSGAGKEPTDDLHFSEVYSNFRAYSIAGTHRHISEMEQELGDISGTGLKITFTPHLLPISRGILTTLYVAPSSDMKEDDLTALYEGRYSREPFVSVRGPEAPLPGVKEVSGTNMCVVAPRFDERAGRVVIISVLDNLVKGAAGAAVQNMNILLGFGERDGLSSLPVHP